MNGNFVLVLHSHLPYVLQHGRWPHGSDWLCEVAVGAYLPILDMLEQLIAEGVSPNITLNITPILLEQLASPLFKAELDDYLSNRIETCRDNEHDFTSRGQVDLARAAQYWSKRLDRVREIWNTLDKDIVGAFGRLSDAGHLEIITSAATHAYLPLLSRDASIRLQFRLAAEIHQRFFGKAPKGLWLPECGYRPGYPWTPPIGPEHGKYHANRPGLEVLAGEQGFEYFVLDSHSLRAGRSPQTYEQIFPALQNLRTKDRDAEMLPSAVRTPYQSYRIEGVPSTERGMSILVRDPICSGQVWGTTDAYPGDAYYCDFHKRHHPGGMRYWRVTDIRSDMVEKSVYEPHRAQECVQKHARDFANRVCSVLKISELGERAVVVAPFDTELFGHWWYEGPDWLGAALRELQKSGVSLKTCGDYLKSYPPDTAVVPAEGSWGAWGDHRVWLNRHTAWTWERLYDAEVQMERIMACVPEENSPELNRLLTQAMRELLLLQSSDWQFLITTESARDYSDRRFAEHYADYKRLMELSIKVMEGYATNEADREFLSYTEKVDCVFPDLDLSWYGDRSGEINAKPVGAGDDHGRRKGRAALPADS